MVAAPVRDPGPERPAAPPPKKRRSLPRRIARIALIVIGVPVLLVVGALVWLHTSSGQAFVRGKVQARLGQRVNGTVELGKLEFALFGDVAIGGLRIKDETGAEAIALDSLRVTPNWRSLTSGSPIVESVALSGLRVHIRQDADGGSNLKRLFKPTPPSPPSAPSKPSRARFQVHQIAISGVGVTIDKPDGTRIAVSDVVIDGFVDAVPGMKTVRLGLPRIGGELSLEKPEGALSLTVSKLETALTVALENGAGKLSLARTQAHARILQKGAEPRDTDLDLHGIELNVAEGELEATLDQLALGALVLASLEVKGKAAGGTLVGDQQASLVGLHIDGAKLNGLLQKQLVATDVDIDTKISGPPEKVVLATAIRTQGGSLDLAGTLDVANPAKPGYDITLTGKDLATARLLVAGATTAPEVEARSIRIGVKGRGATKEDAEADVEVVIGPTRIGKVVLDEVTVEGRYEKGVFVVKRLLVKTLGQKLELAGRFDVVKRHVNGRLSLVGDVGVALSRARAAGIPVKASVAPGTAVIREGDLTIDVDGDLDGVIAVDVAAKRLALAGGAISANAHAEVVKKEPGADGKKFEARALSATVDIHELDLGALAELRGKQLPGVGGTVSGKVKVGGSPAEPNVDYAVQVKARSTLPLSGFFKTPSLVVDLHGTASKHHVDAELTAKRDDGMELLSATAKAPLQIDAAHRGIAPGAPLHIKLDLPRRSFADFLALVPKPIVVGLGKKIPTGDIEAHVDVTGTAERPSGTFDVDVDAGLVADKTQRVHLRGKIVPKDRGTEIASAASVWLDKDKRSALEAEVVTDFSRSPLVPGPREVDWTAGLTVPPTALAELPLPPEKLAGTSGTVGITAKLHGNARDALGRVDVDIADFKRNETGPLDAHVSVEIRPAETALDLGVTAGGDKLLSTTGTIGLGGQGLIPAARAREIGDPKLHIDLDVPRRHVASLARVRPKLAGAPGDVSGHGEVRGTLAVPLADVGLVYDSFKTVGGDPGRAGVELHADAAAVRAGVGIGAAASGGVAPIRIDADVPRAAVSEFRAGKAALPITVSARAAAVDLRTVVPAFAIEGKGVDVAGRLDWNMDGKLALEKTDLGPKLAEGAVNGKLELARGRVVLLGAKRTFEDVELRVTSDATAVRLESLALRESDLDKPNRTLGATARLELHDFHPGKLALDLRAKDWLLFGSERLGPTDAPRGALTADIGVAGDLAGPVKHVKADVRSLEVLFPERFARAHQPEVVSLGNVVYLDEQSPPAGKLRKKAPPPAAEQPGKPPQGEAPPATAEAPAADAPPSGLELVVDIPHPAHLNQAPLDVYAQGRVHAFIGSGTKKVDGRLDIVRGDLMLGGKKHTLDSGAITFDEKNPGGWMDLHFSRELPPSTARDISQASAEGDRVRIDMVGPLGQQKVTMRGAGNAYLYDVLAVNNVGRVRVYSQPDMPASNAVQIPQPDTLLGLTYMSINLPHNLYFEHFNAWSDPYDDPRSYGRVQHLEAEHDASEGRTRVRVVSRPHTTGQSSSELQLDWLFANTSRALFGVGLRGGERAGGGPGLFFEWSSKD